MLNTLLLLAACSSATPAGQGADGGPWFDGADAKRERLAITLTPVASGFSHVTDLQFLPGESTRLVVLEKGGTATLLDLTAPEARQELLKVAVQSSSELGLLGLAFHPKYAENGRFYINSNPAEGPRRTQISEWTQDRATGKLSGPRVILEVEQPFSNHDAGQLAFGPDGYLYIGLGDGGSGGDPHGNGQDPTTLLGGMLRVDIDRADPGLAYGVPADNPFLSERGARPELWAIGLRNPWRFAFDPRGRLIVADVGQNSIEELDVVARGDNLGWNYREGRSCFEPKIGCPSAGLVDPIFTYSHDEGVSITGGYVWTSPAAPALVGWYLFGDFGTGRLWALDTRGELVPGQDAPVRTLGRWRLNPSTFGRAADGTVYVADYGSGTLYRIGVSP